MAVALCDICQTASLFGRHLGATAAAALSLRLMATRRTVRSRLDFEENPKPSNSADLEIAVGLPAPWSDRLGSLLRPGSLGRRWAMCEWFCSPVDAPFLQAGEFAAMVVAAGVEDRPLPRYRWRELRRVIGRPRRFSPAFIQTEHANMIKAREEEIGLRVRIALNRSVHCLP